MSTPTNSSVTISRSGVVVTQVGEGAGPTGGVLQSSFNTLAGRVTTLETTGASGVTLTTINALTGRVGVLEGKSHHELPDSRLSKLESNVNILMTTGGGGVSANAVVYDSTYVTRKVVSKYPFDAYSANKELKLMKQDSFYKDLVDLNGNSNGDDLKEFDFTGFPSASVDNNMAAKGFGERYFTPVSIKNNATFGHMALMIGDDSVYYDPADDSAKVTQGYAGEARGPGGISSYGGEYIQGKKFLSSILASNDTVLRYRVVLPDMSQFIDPQSDDADKTHFMRIRMITSTQEDGVVYPALVGLASTGGGGYDTDGDFGVIYTGAVGVIDVAVGSLTEVARMSGDKTNVFDVQFDTNTQLTFEFAKAGNRGSMFYDVVSFIIEEVWYETGIAKALENLTITGVFDAPVLDLKADKVALDLLNARKYDTGVVDAKLLAKTNSDQKAGSLYEHTLVTNEKRKAFIGLDTMSDTFKVIPNYSLSNRTGYGGNLANMATGDLVISRYTDTTQILGDANIVTFNSYVGTSNTLASNLTASTSSNVDVGDMNLAFTQDLGQDIQYAFVDLKGDGNRWLQIGTVEPVDGDDTKGPVDGGKMYVDMKFKTLDAGSNVYRVNLETFTSSETNYDYLIVYVNGVRKYRLTGVDKYDSPTVDIKFGDVVRVSYEKDDWAEGTDTVAFRIASVDRIKPSQAEEKFNVVDKLADRPVRSEVTSMVSNIMLNSDTALNSIMELSNALGNDNNYATTLTTALNSKADQSAFSNVQNTSDADKQISTLTQTALDLKANQSAFSNVENTSDLLKPVSDDTKTALDLKADKSAFSNVENTSDLLKPVSDDTKTALDLKADKSAFSNVNDTSDASKPVSSLTQTALDLKAPLASPTFTGVVSASNYSTFSGDLIIDENRHITANTLVLGVSGSNVFTQAMIDYLVSVMPV
jgi:hypothetical protein